MTETWWVAPGEELWCGEGEARGWTVRFLWDDGTHWGLAITNDATNSSENAQWDWSSDDLNVHVGSLPTAVLRSLSATLKKCSPRMLSAVEQKVLDHIAIETLTSKGRCISGRALRHWGSGNAISEEAIDASIRSLMPRYVGVIPPGESEMHFATLDGLLRSERSRERSFNALNAILAALRRGYDADPDMRSLKVTDLGPNAIVSDARVIMDATKLSTNFDGHAWQLIAGRELERVWKHSSSAEQFIGWIRSAESGRPWSTAPQRSPFTTVNHGPSDQRRTVPEIVERRSLRVTFWNMRTDTPDALALVAELRTLLAPISVEITVSSAATFSRDSDGWLTALVDVALAEAFAQLPADARRLVERRLRAIGAYTDVLNYVEVPVDDEKHLVQVDASEFYLDGMPTFPAYVRAWKGILELPQIYKVRWELRGSDWYPRWALIVGEEYERDLSSFWNRIDRVRVLACVKTAPWHVHVDRALWVLECDEDLKQGTAFTLANGRALTCSHVLGTATLAFRAATPSEKHRVRVLYRCPERDLAILDIENSSAGLELNSTYQPAIGESVRLAGFPNYRIGDTGHFQSTAIASKRNVVGRPRILVAGPIVVGMSGGPVVDDQHRVVGVVVTGADDQSNSMVTEAHGFIPGSVVAEFLTEFTARSNSAN